MRPVKVRVPAASQKTESVAIDIPRPGDPGYPWAIKRSAPVDVQTGGAKRPLELVPLVSYQTPQTHLQPQPQPQPITSKEPLTSQPSLDPDDVKQVPYERVRIMHAPLEKIPEPSTSTAYFSCRRCQCAGHSVWITHIHTHGGCTWVSHVGEPQDGLSRWFLGPLSTSKS